MIDDPTKNDALSEKADLGKWHADVWKEELTFYAGHGVTTPAQARAFVDSVRVNSENAAIFAYMLLRREEDKRYDQKENI